MTESAGILLEDDERLNFRLADSNDHVAVRPHPRPASHSRLEWQRLAYYLIGGILSLGSLLLLAEQINPPDSALRGQAMAAQLGAWDGVWSGNLTRIDLSGAPPQAVESRREYFSSANDVQSVSVVNRLPEGKSDSHVWVYQFGPEGQLTAQRAGEDGGLQYTGHIQDSRLVWMGRSNDALEIHTSWIRQNTLVVQEQHIPLSSPELGWVITGELSRE